MDKIKDYAFNRKVIGEVLQDEGVTPTMVISVMARYLTAHQAEQVVNELRLSEGGY
jgi:hypothetical protein